VSLIDVLAAIDDAVGERQAFAVIGAVARNAWAPPRATTDLDLAVSARPETLDAIDDGLRSLGYRRVRHQQAEPADPLPDIVIYRAEHAEPRQVDLLVAKTPFEEKVIERAEQTEIGSRRLPVASPEDLVVYKLLADRPRDWDDIRAVLRTQDRTARAFDWAHVERWTEFWQITDRLHRLRASLGGGFR
jgi:hypothetical protein